MPAEPSEDDGNAGHLAMLGTKLLQGGRTKDALMKLLKQASTHLERADQSSDSQRHAALDLSRALVQKHMIGSKDKDMQLYVTFCLMHILRLHAPDSPYDETQLQAVFAMLFTTLRRLAMPGSPSFRVCLSILDTISQVKCCVLILDNADDTALCDLAHVLFDTISCENEGQVKLLMVELLASLIEESDDVSQRMLDLLLGCAIDRDNESQPACRRLAQAVLQRAEVPIRPSLQRFLTTIIIGDPTDSELKDQRFDIIMQVYKSSPQTLLPVLPHLESELRDNDATKRIAAVQLLGSLFGQGGSDLDSAYTQLFAEFLRRFRDAEVRKEALRLTGSLLRGCSSASIRREVLRAAADRLLDTDEKVRMAAIEGIADAAQTSLSLLEGTVQPLTAVADRLRDVKPAVVRTAAEKLLWVFKTYAVQRDQGTLVSSDEELVAWLPGRLLLEAARNAAAVHSLMDGPLRAGIFPAKMSLESQARQWAAVYLAAGERERRALRTLLRGRLTVQAAVMRLLQARAAEAAAEDPAHRQVELKAAMKQVCRAFPDMPNAEELLGKLLQHKDNHIFRGLATIATLGCSREVAAAAAKDVQQRLGGRGSQTDFMKTLIGRLVPSLLCPEHVTALLELAKKITADGEEGPFLQSVLDLLIDVADASPGLYENAWGSLCALLVEDDPQLAVTAARLLAAAGGAMRLSAASAEDRADTTAALLALCRDGPISGAKAAPQAIMAVEDRSAATEHLASLMDELLSRLTKAGAVGDPKLLVTMAAMSSIGRILPEVFAPSAAQTARFVLGPLLRAAVSLPRKRTPPKSGRGWGQASAHIKVTAYAVKALARACVPDSHPQQTIPAALSEVAASLISRLLQLLDPDVDQRPVTDVEAAALRLAAAGALLRLVRCHESLLTVMGYRTLALVMQDPVVEVRREFGRKVTRLVNFLQERADRSQRGAKYAAVLALAAMDPVSSHQEAAFRFLLDYVRRCSAPLHGTVSTVSAGGATLLHEQPHFVLPFLLHLLAHHPDFPDEQVAEHVDDQTPYEPFALMLQFALEPLLLPNGGAAASPHSLSAIAKILRTLKRTSDASPTPKTHNLRLLADYALGVAQMVAGQVLKRPVQALVTDKPGYVVLPSQFYMLDGTMHSGSHGKSGLRVEQRPLYSQQFVAVAVGRHTTAARGQMQLLPQAKAKALAKRKHVQATGKTSRRVAAKLSEPLRAVDLNMETDEEETQDEEQEGMEV